MLCLRVHITITPGLLHAGAVVPDTVGMTEGTVSVAVTALPQALQGMTGETMLVALLSVGHFGANLTLSAASQGPDGDSIHHVGLRPLWSVHHAHLLNNSFALRTGAGPGSAAISGADASLPLHFMGDVDGNGMPDVIIGLPDVDSCVLFLLAPTGIRLSMVLGIRQPQGALHTLITPGWCFAQEVCGDLDPLNAYVPGAEPGAWPLAATAIDHDGTIHRSRQIKDFGFSWRGDLAQPQGPLNFTGQQVRFGSAIEVLDINRDGLLDLVISAPRHNAHEGDGGGRGTLIVIALTLRQVPATVTYIGTQLLPVIPPFYPDVGAIGAVPLVLHPADPTPRSVGAFFAVVGFEETAMRMRLVMGISDLSDPNWPVNDFLCLTVALNVSGSIPGLPFTSATAAPLLAAITPPSINVSVVGGKLVNISDATLWPLITDGPLTGTNQRWHFSPVAITATADFNGKGMLFTTAVVQVGLWGCQAARFLATMDWSREEYWDFTAEGPAPPVIPMLTGFLPASAAAYDPSTGTVGVPGSGSSGGSAVRSHGEEPHGTVGLGGVPSLASHAAFRHSSDFDPHNDAATVTPAEPSGLQLTFLTLSTGARRPGLRVYRHVGHVIPAPLECQAANQPEPCQGMRSFDGITPLSAAYGAALAPFQDPLARIDLPCAPSASLSMQFRSATRRITSSQHTLPRCASSYAAVFCRRSCKCYVVFLFTRCSLPCASPYLPLPPPPPPPPSSPSSLFPPCPSWLLRCTSQVPPVPPCSTMPPT